MPILYTVQQTADYFQVTTRCIYNWIAEGRLEKKKFASAVRIPLSSIEAYYNNPW